MDESFDPYRTGVIGFFLPTIPFDSNASMERGYLKIHKDGELYVKTLNEDLDDGFNRYGQPVEHISGITESGEVVLFNVSSAGGAMKFGGAASVFDYRARTMLTGLDATGYSTGDAVGAGIFMYGLDTWCGMSGASESRTNYPDGTLKSWSVELSEAPSTHAVLHSGLDLSLGGHWKVDGPLDERRMHSPILVKASSVAAPVALTQLLRPLRRVQGLVSLAFGGFVAARGGRAQIDDESQDAELWDAWLMVPRDGVSAPKSMHQPPLFTMEALGGIDGVARWIERAESYPMVVGALTDQFYVGGASAEARLIAACVGIEHWRTAHRRLRNPWANDDLYPRAVASTLGARFSSWIDDVTVWADRTWTAYLDVKHDRANSIDPLTAHYFAESARLVLLAAVLNDAAGSTRPSDQIFNSYRTYNLGERVRSLIGGSP